MQKVLLDAINWVSQTFYETTPATILTTPTPLSAPFGDGLIVPQEIFVRCLMQVTAPEFLRAVHTWRLVSKSHFFYCQAELIYERLYLAVFNKTLSPPLIPQGKTWQVSYEERLNKEEQWFNYLIDNKFLRFFTSYNFHLPDIVWDKDSLPLIFCMNSEEQTCLTYAEGSMKQEVSLPHTSIDRTRLIHAFALAISDRKWVTIQHEQWSGDQYRWTIWDYSLFSFKSLDPLNPAKPVATISFGTTACRPIHSCTWKGDVYILCKCMNKDQKPSLVVQRLDSAYQVTQQAVRVVKEVQEEGAFVSSNYIKAELISDKEGLLVVHFDAYQKQLVCWEALNGQTLWSAPSVSLFTSRPLDSYFAYSQDSGELIVAYLSKGDQLCVKKVRSQEEVLKISKPKILIGRFVFCSTYAHSGIAVFFDLDKTLYWYALKTGKGELIDTYHKQSRALLPLQLGRHNLLLVETKAQAEHAVQLSVYDLQKLKKLGAFTDPQCTIMDRPPCAWLSLRGHDFDHCYISSVSRQLGQKLEMWDLSQKRI